METQNKKGVTSFVIKVVAIVTMFIDHTAAVFLERQLSNPAKAFVSGPEYYYKIYRIDQVMRGIGRIAFPLFIFLLIQGFMHTKSKYKYAFRLGLFALISEVPFDMAFRNSYFSTSYQNVFFTLFLGFMFMLLTDLIYQKNIPPVLGYAGIIASSLVGGAFIAKYLKMVDVPRFSELADKSLLGAVALVAAVVAVIEILVCLKRPFEDLSKLALSMLVLSAAMWAAYLLNTDYSAAGVIAIAIAFALRKNKLACFLGALAALVMFSSTFEIYAIFGAILIFFYNGERGKSMKYFFYAFYPCHLLLISLTAMFLGL
ncbi:MAG: hypothetical protein J5626_04155 [Lachnospiraceae bacterium]|nr:hypothetical protein [Lachnospiraceae bacterium]